MWAPLRDYREPRDWRLWKEPAGFFMPGCVCCGALDGGYWTKGNGTSAQPQKMSFSTEICTIKTNASLVHATPRCCSVSNNNDAGYYLGNESFFANNADKISFATDTTAAQTTARLSTVRAFTAGLSDRDTKGYVAGGGTSNLTANITVATDQITFATDSTAAQTTANLSIGRAGLYGMSEGSTKGYFIGGKRTDNVVVVVADVIMFSTDTTSAVTTANASAGRITHAAVSDGTLAGYNAGGGNIPTDICDKTTFSTDVTAAITSGKLSTKRTLLGGMSQGSVYGYWNSGFNSSIANTLTSDRITYATDVTAANTTSNLLYVSNTVVGMSQTGL